MIRKQDLLCSRPWVSRLKNNFKIMATQAQIAKSLKKPKFSSRTVKRCWRCGRANGYLSYFKICRICFRELAVTGMLPGVSKASW